MEVPGYGDAAYLTCESCKSWFSSFRHRAACVLAKDSGFGFAPTEDDFRAAYDVLEWKLWGPWGS